MSLSSCLFDCDARGVVHYELECGALPVAFPVAFVGRYKLLEHITPNRGREIGVMQHDSLAAKLTHHETHPRTYRRSLVLQQEPHPKALVPG